MGIVTRKKTYPDGRVVEEVIDMDKHKVTKTKESKADGSKDTPEKARKSVSKTYTTSSSS
jgi:hypothetical protein